jgi:hypothetical protein
MKLFSLVFLWLLFAHLANAQTDSGTSVYNKGLGETYKGYYYPSTHTFITCGDYKTINVPDDDFAKIQYCGSPCECTDCICKSGPPHLDTASHTTLKSKLK